MSVGWSGYEQRLGSDHAAMSDMIMRETLQTKEEIQ